MRFAVGLTKLIWVFGSELARHIWSVAAQSLRTSPPPPPPQSTRLRWRHAALCIGFDYPRSTMELNGCQADAEVFARILARNGDDGNCCVPQLIIDRPTLQNVSGTQCACDVRNAISQLAEDARIAFVERAERSAIVITYAGHGASITDEFAREERDGVDEALVAPDRLITDDEFRAWLGAFGPEARVILVLDCCHSGTVADLAFGTDENDRVVRENPNEPLRAEVLCLSGARDAGYTFETSDATGASRGAFSLVLQTTSATCFWEGVSCSPHDLLALTAQKTGALVDDVDGFCPDVDQAPRVTASRPHLFNDTNFFAPWRRTC